MRVVGRPTNGILGAVCSRCQGPVGPAAGRPPPPPRRVRRDLGRASARPGRRARGQHRPLARGQIANDRCSPGLRVDRRTPGRRRRGVQRSRAAESVVGLPHAVQPRPAGRAVDTVVARPLRHQQPQGGEPGTHAAAERGFPPPRPGAVSESCWVPSSETRRS